MKLAPIHQYALGLPEVSEAPHHHFSSFRVRVKIFATAPPDETCLHLFLDDQTREEALALHGEFIEKLLWGGKVVGVRVNLVSAKPSVVKKLVLCASQNKAPKTLLAD